MRMIASGLGLGGLLAVLFEQRGDAGITIYERHQRYDIELRVAKQHALHANVPCRAPSTEDARNQLLVKQATGKHGKRVRGRKPPHYMGW